METAICGITQAQTKCKQGKSWGICSKGITWGTLTGLLKIPFELQYCKKEKGNEAKRILVHKISKIVMRNGSK